MISSRPPGSPEKRSYQRYTIWFPLTLKLPDREIWAICRDASPGGVLISAVTPLEKGTKLELHFRVTPGNDQERIVPASVVRQELNRDELVLAFPYRLALEFTSPMQDLLDELSVHAEGIKD